MTRKHFEIVAEVLANLCEDGSYCFDDDADKIRIADRFAERFQAINPRFNRDKFVKVVTGFSDELLRELEKGEEI